MLRCLRLPSFACFAFCLPTLLAWAKRQQHNMSNGAKFLLTCCAALCLSCFLGCANLNPVGSRVEPGAATTPLLLRHVQVVEVGQGFSRAVLLRLSRPPDFVRHEGKSRPARVVIEAAATNAGEDFSERAMPQADVELKGVRVARKKGVLRVTLELSRDEPPPYAVQEMADWILIRFGPLVPSS